MVGGWTDEPRDNSWWGNSPDERCIVVPEYNLRGLFPPCIENDPHATGSPGIHHYLGVEAKM